LYLDKQAVTARFFTLCPSFMACSAAQTCTIIHLDAAPPIHIVSNHQTMLCDKLTSQKGGKFHWPALMYCCMGLWTYVLSEWVVLWQNKLILFGERSICLISSELVGTTLHTN